MRKSDGKCHDFTTKSNEYGKRTNVWEIRGGYMVSSPDKISFKHPATFPEVLVKDHIISWSNENDLIYDPMAGSGTTLKMAKLNNRNYIGSEISKEYCDIIEKRLETKTILKLPVFP